MGVKDSRKGNEGTYVEHARRSEVEYLVSFEEWERSLSPADRARLGRAAAPDLEDHRAMGTKRMVIGLERDAADSSAASYSVDVAGVVDGPAEQLCELAGISMEQARKVVAWADARVEREAADRKSRVVVKVAGAFLNCANAKLMAAGLAYASDLALTTGMGTMNDYAASIAVSRQAVSKVAKFWQRELELAPGSHMRDEEKCAAYSQAQKAKHWRKNLCNKLNKKN